MGTGRSERTVIQKCDGLFFMFTKKMGDCIEKGLLPNCQKSAHKHGKGDTEQGSSGVHRKQKNGVCERVCDVNFDLKILKSEFKKLLKSGQESIQKYCSSLPVIIKFQINQLFR